MTSGAVEWPTFHKLSLQWNLETNFELFLWPSFMVCDTQIKCIFFRVRVRVLCSKVRHTPVDQTASGLRMNSFGQFKEKHVL